MVESGSPAVEALRRDLARRRKPPAFSPRGWDVSHFNFHPRVRRAMRLPRSVTVCDITLREGEQTAGLLALSKEQKVQLARALADAGVPQIQVGFVIRRPRAQAEIRAIAEANVGAELVTYAVTPAEVDIARDCGVDVVELITPAFPSLHFALGEYFTSERQQVEKALRYIDYAKAKGLKVRIDVNWAGMADLGFLKRYYKAVADAGADYVHFADSGGTLTPSALRFVIGEVKSVIPNTPIGLHLHNDFGLATALALAAVEGGAEVVDVAVNGLGERAGNPHLAEVVAALTMLYGVPTGVDLTKLCSLSALCEELTGFPLPTNKPIVGKYAFTTTVEIHAVTKPVDRWLSAPVDPQSVGNEKLLVFGKHSGLAALRQKLDSLGLAVADADLPALHERLNAIIDVKRTLDDDDIRAAVAGDAGPVR